MSRSVGNAVENSFVKGVVTEFSGLNFPENSCTDALNVVFTDKGEVHRRSGIDLEDDFELEPVAIGTNAIGSFHWKTAGGKSENSFVVQQVGRYLYFYRVGFSLSPNQAAFTFDLYIYATNTSNLANELCQFAGGSGKLFVVHPSSEPFFIEYHPETDSISHEFYYVRIRDFTVLEDGLETTETPTAFIPNHQYNIYNQGWSYALRDTWAGANGTYPAKSMTWWFYKDPTGTYPLPEFMKPLYRTRVPEIGNTLAPRGSLILNAFFQDRSGAIGIGGLPSTSSGTQRPSAVAFMNGRVFLSGVNAAGYNGTIYFSQILKTDTSEILFYQNGDPTSEVNYQLLPNDGGVIIIPEAGRIVYMYQVKNALMVFATNGVWAIQGSEGIGFTATDYSIEKVSETSALAHPSFVVVENNPLFWNQEGIYIVQGNPVGGMEVSSLTKQTIQTIYDSIPLESKLHAKAAFNRLTKEVFWLYSENPDDPRDYTKLMVLRATTQAFYFHELSEGVRILDIISIGGSYSVVNQAVVFDNDGEVVVDDADAVVTVSENIRSDTVSSLKFYSEYGTNLATYSDLSNTSHADWPSTGTAREFDSYFVSGYRVRGEGQKKSQVPYITVHTKHQSNNSAFFQAIWDYRNSLTTGGVTNQQQVCRIDSARDFVTRKLKVRGNGISCQFKFFSEGIKPFTITGWATSESVNDRV